MLSFVASCSLYAGPSGHHCCVWFRWVISCCGFFCDLTPFSQPHDTSRGLWCVSHLMEGSHTRKRCMAYSVLIWGRQWFFQTLLKFWTCRAESYSPIPKTMARALRCHKALRLVWPGKGSGHNTQVSLWACHEQPPLHCLDLASSDPANILTWKLRPRFKHRRHCFIK